MAKKNKHDQELENMMDDGTALSNVQKDLLDDENLFIDDNPRDWVANQKVDENGLNIKHHLLICHIAIIAGCFPDDRFPKLKDKYNQYYKERNLDAIGVKADSFYKSYSSVLYANVETYNEQGEFEIVRKKYIDSTLIDDVTPFVRQWYPSAESLILTLNVAPERFEELHYYWIYRTIRGKYPQESMKAFFKEHCPHLNYDTFKYQEQNRTAVIPDDVAKLIKPYIQAHYPDAL